jgi:hypothetical protein
VDNTCEVIEVQKQQAAKFLCSACGADRGCDCNAPAIEKLAAKMEQDRQRSKASRERKTQQKQQSRHVTGNDVDAEASAEDRKREAGASQERGNALESEPSEARNGKRVHPSVVYPAAAVPTDTTPVESPAVEYIREDYMLLDNCTDEWFVVTNASFGPFDTQEAAQRWADAQRKAPAPAAVAPTAAVRRADAACAEALGAAEEEEDDVFELLRKRNKLEDRVDQLTEALNAKETEAGHNWPADMTAKQIKKRDRYLGNIAWWQRELEKLYGEVTGQPPWRVELIKKDGARFNNGARLATHGEAEAYGQAEARRAEGKIEFEVLPCEGEKANMEFVGTSVRFSHGDCVLLNWHPIESKPPATTAGSIQPGTKAPEKATAAVELTVPRSVPVANGNSVDTNVAAEAMKAKHGRLADDDLSIPASLRRLQ